METIKDYLLYKTNIGDLVVIKQCGWILGIVHISTEDLFKTFISENILEQKIKKIEYGNKYEIKNGVFIDCIILEI